MSEPRVDHAEHRLAGGDWRDAVDILRGVLTANPDDAQGHAVLALALLAGKRERAAAVEARTSLELDGGSAYAHYAMAAALHATGDRREAWRHCQVALTSAVESSQSDIDVGVHVLGAEIRLARGEREAARELLESIVPRFPTHAAPRVALAKLELAAGRPVEAARHAADATRYQPKNVGAAVAAGNAALAQGDVAAAERHLRRGLALDQNDRDGLALWTRIKARKNPITGLGWRWSAWIAQRSDDRHVGMLVATFLLVQLALVLANAAGLPGVQSWLMWGWAAFCIYSWYAPTLFERLLARDLGARGTT